MANVALIPNERKVYRAMSNPSWVKRGQVTFRAFMLRPASEKFPIPEAEISLGLTPQSAIDELRENSGIGELLVSAVHELPHGLAIRQDRNSQHKAELFGLPLFSTDPAQISAAVGMATDLAFITRLLPPDPQPQ